MLLFERSEYLERIAAVKRRMDAAGIDVLLISDPCNMNYLTGYDATSYYVQSRATIVSFRRGSRKSRPLRASSNFLASRPSRSSGSSVSSGSSPLTHHPNDW